MGRDPPLRLAWRGWLGKFDPEKEAKGAPSRDFLGGRGVVRAFAFWLVLPILLSSKSIDFSINRPFIALLDLLDASINRG